MRFVSQCTVQSCFCMMEVHRAVKSQAVACTGEAVMCSTRGEVQAQSCHCITYDS